MFHRLYVAWNEYSWARCRGSYNRFCCTKMPVHSAILYALSELFSRGGCKWQRFGK